MSALRSAIVRQFKRPSGLLGRLAGLSMLTRPSNRRRNRWTLDLLDLQETDHVFELGCGPGYALSLAAKRTRRGFVTGADHSPVMAQMARRRLANPMRQGRADVLVGGEALLKAFEGSLNAIYSANVVQFLDDPARYFALAAAALAPGGRIATTYQPRGRRPSKAQADAMAQTCAAAMAAAGLIGVRTEWLALPRAPAVCVLGAKPAAAP